MALKYVSSAEMEAYQKSLLIFAKGAPSLECIRSHYLPDASGKCDLTKAKEQEEIFVLANRSGSTLKVSRASMDIIANIIEIVGASKWFENLQAQKKNHKEKLKSAQEARERDRKASSRVVLRRKRSL